ncbi:MAG: 1,2-phenylacetyl-CoA epoxidase subunit PaaE [Mycobacteriaceae bacterium]
MTTTAPQSPTAPTPKRAKFNPLTVTGVRPLTDEAVEVTFGVPEDLVEDYNYVPGQYVALRATIDGTEVRRSYSICAAPQPGEIRVAIKKTLGGVFSTWANEALGAGDVIEVMNPQGAFTQKVRTTAMNDPAGLVATQLEHNPRARLVAFAAGSGITPVMAIATATLASSPDATFELVYANKSTVDVMFAEEIGDLKDRYPDRFTVHHVLSRENRTSPLHTGRIDDEKLSLMLDRMLRAGDVEEWFLCGPFDLVQLARDELKDRDVPEDRVRFELFTTGKPTTPDGQQGRAIEVKDNEPVYDVGFTLDGASSTVASPRSARETILNAALRSRPDVPFACAGGVCGTCRAKLVSGTCDMDENFALEPDEVEAGYVLTCQSRPTSDAVEVNFDA